MARPSQESRAPKVQIEINGRKRVPDELVPDSHIKEVKNVKTLSFTQQLRDYLDYAKANGIKFILVTPLTPDKMSKPLREAIERGDIVPEMLTAAQECAGKRKDGSGS